MVVSHRLFGGGWSAPLKRELFQRGDAVGVLLYDPRRHLIGLVEQFRVGAMQDQFGPWQYEVVAGMIGPEESPVEVATRECQEEAGIEVENLIPICNYLVSAGGTDEIVKNSIGERVLGLAPEPRTDKGVPFNELSS